MSDFLKSIIKEVGNEYAALVEDGVEAGDVDSFIDTGSYIFNALLSGSLYGGLPSNKITALAGESATGKTYFLMGIVKNFLDKDPEAGVIYFESESALTKQLIVDRGIDPKRMVLMPVTTVQEFRHDALKTLDSYIAQNEADRRPLFLCLDSLGMLSTTKEVEDTAEGKETRDMTRAQVLKAAFRVLTLKLGRAKVPMVVTNHTYDVIGSMFPQKEMGGGCLVAETNILTKNGYMPIENIKPGQQVFTKEGTFENVLESHYFKNKDILEIEFEGGFKVRCTPEHKFLINGEWIEAKNIMVFQILKGYDMKTLKVKSIKNVGKADVYDISVDKNENYILENGMITHNSGLKYAASSIIYLSKRKEKVGTEIVGNIIHCKNHKSRLTVENRMVDIRLTYDKGLDRYYGLLELAEKYGVFKKVSTRYELPDGSKQFGKTIMNDPKTYFTEEIMAKLEECAAKEYRYAATN